MVALASDRREPLEDEDRRYVLDRLVDEELLVQRGLELGFARLDKRVRADLVQAVIQSVVADADRREPTAAEVSEFYEENRDYFTRPGRMRVRQIWVQAGSRRPDAEARARAEEAARRLRAGEPLLQVAEALGDPIVAPVPDASLPATKLSEYLSPSVVRQLLHTEVGAVTEPLRAMGGYHVLRLVAREPAVVPPLSAIETEVRAETRRRAGDRALRRYLDELRERAHVTVADVAP